METHPLDSLEEQPGDVPEDVAILYSWANMEGAKYRDFSASRREYRAQMRHRAAEQLRQAELQAQVEAEAAARQAEEAAAIAHSRAEEAAARLVAKQGPRSVSRGFNGSERADIAHDSREEQERLKAASLRSAVQQARKAAMEREEASRRAKAAAFAESIARREEQEIAEAQASAIRQAAQYAEAGGRPRTSNGSGLHEWIPGEMSDPHPTPWTDEQERFSLADAGEDGPGWMFVPAAAPASEVTVHQPHELRNAEAQNERDVVRTDDPLDAFAATPFAQPAPSTQPIAMLNEQRPNNQGLVNGIQVGPVKGIIASPVSTAVEQVFSGNQDHLQVEVVNRIPAETEALATNVAEQNVQAATPVAVRTLVTEFWPVEAVPETELAPVRREAVAPRPLSSGASLPQEDHPAPAWLYPSRQPAASPQKIGSADAPPPPIAVAKLPERLSGQGLETPKEPIATRWFGLRSLFSRRDAEGEHNREPVREKVRQAPILAVFSIAGGVGKTSLVATLGCALSRSGEKVLLGDAASHSLLPFYFGSSKRLPGVVRMFLPPPEVAGMPVNLVNYDIPSESDGVPGQTTIADGLLANSLNTHRMLLDLNISSQGILERLRQFQPTVLVPLIPDMNSVISIETIEKIFDSIFDAEGKPLKPVYLLNQFDAGSPLHLDIREILKQQLGERLLPFVVRRSPGVSEALAEGMTIIDYDPESAIAQDYLRVANWLRSLSATAGTGLRNQRWSEQ